MDSFVHSKKKGGIGYGKTQKKHLESGFIICSHAHNACKYPYNVFCRRI